MSFLKSIFFGNQESYDICGIQIKFEKEIPPNFNPVNLEGAGLISQIALRCMNSDVFRMMTQGDIHVFVHEMSHALACKLLTKQNSKITFFTNPCIGVTVFPPESLIDSDWKQTIMDVAGSMGDIAFSSCQLVAAIALKNYISWPVAMALGGGNVLWMHGELLYAYVSASKEDYGDFGKISRRGNTHLALASTALIAQYALGIFAAIKSMDNG